MSGTEQDTASSHPTADSNLAVAKDHIAASEGNAVTGKSGEPMSVDDGSKQDADADMKATNIVQDTEGKGKRKADDDDDDDNEEEKEKEDDSDVEQPEGSQGDFEDHSEYNSDESVGPGRSPLAGTANHEVAPIYSKPLRLKAVQLMNTAPRETLRIARSGDIETLQMVAAAASLIPPHLGGYASDVIIHHLRQSLPRQNQQESNTKELDKGERLAIVSIVALVELLAFFTTSDVIDTVRLSWKSMMRWMVYLKDNHLGKDQDFRSGLLAQGISALLYDVLTFDKTLKKQLCTDFSMKKFVARLWAMPNSGADSQGFASRCLTIFLQHSPATARTTHDILCSTCFVPDVVSIELFNLISLAYNFDHLDAYASVLLAFRSDSCPDMEYTLLNDQTIMELSRKLAYRLKDIPPPGSADRKVACSAFSKLTSWVMESTASILGNLFIHEVFYNDFLRSLVILGPLFDEYRAQPTRRTVTKFLCRTLPRHIVRKTLFEATLEAMQATLAPDMRPIAMASSFANDWVALEMLVRERAAYRIFYERKEDMGLLPRLCVNPDCDVNEDAVVFKICSSCKLVKYCSVQCQAAHWKRSHKSACKEKQEVSKSKDSEKSEKEIDMENFWFYCARRDIIRHLPGLRKLATERFPNMPFHLVGVGIDYTSFPPAFQVFPLEALFSDSTSGSDRDIAEHTYRIHRLAQKGKDGTILTKITQPQGPAGFTIKFVEVLISNADSFDIKKPLFGEKVPRQIGQDDESRELEVVEYDRIDEFFNSLIPEVYTIDDAALTQIMRRLRKPEPEKKGSERIRVREIIMPAESSSFTFSMPA